MDNVINTVIDIFLRAHEAFSLSFWIDFFKALEGMSLIEVLLFIAVSGLIVFMGGLLFATLCYPVYWLLFERRIRRNISEIKSHIEAWDVTIEAFNGSHNATS